MGRKKRFVILSGPSGVGKGPLQEAVRKLYPGLIDCRPVLCTSRPPRRGEIHGKDYHFLPEAFIRSLASSPDFAVSPVRSDWQAIHLPEVDALLRKQRLVFAEVFYTFGPSLLKRARRRNFDSLRVFLLPLPSSAKQSQVIAEIRGKLTRRATDESKKIRDRANSAPKEIAKAKSYTHLLVNPAGEDDISEWRSLGRRKGRKGRGQVKCLADLGPNAKWLVQTFVKILKGKLPPGEYSR